MFTFVDGHDSPPPTTQDWLTICFDFEWADGIYGHGVLFWECCVRKWGHDWVNTQITNQVWLHRPLKLSMLICPYCFQGEFMHVLKPITIYMDDQWALFMASNLVINQRFKHMDLRYQMIQDCITKGPLKLEFVSNDKNISDITNTGPYRVMHRQFTKMLLQCVE